MRLPAGKSNEMSTGKGIIYGLGLGPGDPDLMSVKADRILRKSSHVAYFCLLYTSPSPRDQRGSRMPSSA